MRLLAPAVPKCGEFSFNLSALDPSVYLLKAELHLWLNILSPLQQNVYLASIEPVYEDGRESKPVLRLITIDWSASDHYVVFEVNEMLRDLTTQGVCTLLFK